MKSIDEQEQICLYLFCGLPCSGKTTLAISLAESKDAVFFSLDRLILKLFPEEDNFKTHRQYVQRFEDVCKLSTYFGNYNLSKLIFNHNGDNYKTQSSGVIVSTSQL